VIGSRWLAGFSEARGLQGGRADFQLALMSSARARIEQGGNPWVLRRKSVTERGGSLK